MSRKPKGSGGRSAIAQDLLRDNFEDLDMDPSNVVNQEGNSISELYPQIPPPLSADLLTTQAANCILKQSIITRRFKLSSYQSGNKRGYLADMKCHNSKNTADDENRALLHGFLHRIPDPTQYFPIELLADHGFSSRRESSRALSGRKNGSDSSKRSKRPRTGSQSNSSGEAGGEIFGHLEKKERAASSSSAEGDTAATGSKAVELGSDAEEDEDEVDEYGLDDDYGVSHSYSDDNGGGFSDEEHTFNDM